MSVLHWLSELISNVYPVFCTVIQYIVCYQGLPDRKVPYYGWAPERTRRKLMGSARVYLVSILEVTVQPAALIIARV